MKIAYICSDVEVEVFGHEGCSVHIREFTNSLISLGHEVIILCAWPGRGYKAEAKAKVYHPTPRDFAAAACQQIDREPAVRNANLQRDLKSVFHNLWLENEGAQILEKERPDFIYERYALFGWAGVSLARRFAIPHITELNAPLCDQQEGYDQFVLARTARALEAQILSGSDAVIALSPWLKQWTVSLGADEARVHLIPDAVSERVFSAVASGDTVRRKYGLNGKPTIGFVGSFQHWHDVPGLLRAFQRLHRKDKDLRLLLVGYGERTDACRQLARDLKVSDAVIFTGSVAHKKVPQYVAAMDVAVVPYPKMRQFFFSPLKLFEYMAVGKPAVAASLGQIAEVIEHGKDGLLYTPGDVSSLAAEIAKVLYEPELAAEMGAAARAKVLARHTWRNVAEQVIEIARNLGAGGGKARRRRRKSQPA